MTPSPAEQMREYGDIVEAMGAAMRKNREYGGGIIHADAKAALAVIADILRPVDELLSRLIDDPKVSMGEIEDCRAQIREFSP